MTMLVYKSGPRNSVQHLPASAVNAGDVVIVNNLALYADLDNPPNAQDPIRQMSLFVGGIVQANADAAYGVGNYVFWDTAKQQVSQDQTATAYPFGWIVAGPQGLSSDGGPTGPGSSCFVLHAPQGAI